MIAMILAGFVIGGYNIKGLIFENSAGYFINALADNFKLIDCEFRNGAKNAVLVKGYNNLVSTCDFYNIGAEIIL